MNAQPVAGVDVALPELIALRLRARRLARPATRVAGIHSAAHASRFRGRGVDYAESRIYQPGDDIRQMDWRVTARSGKPHTKVFEEEREQGVLLIVDENPAMRFGTRVRFKSVQAARVAALIAWTAARNGDRIGALGFGAGIDAEVKPGGGARGALHVLRALAEWDAQADRTTQVPLSQALQRARRIARPGSRVVLISDGFSADADAQGPLSLLADHCDVAVIVLGDTLELAAPAPGRYALQGDSGRVLLDFAAARTRADWQHWFAQHRANLTRLCDKRALRWVLLETHAEPDAAVAQLLNSDARRRRAANA
ncbi:MAG: DUF58 domain-containing protein [Proteobacteria bacterium]|nr:DUF58 domain-containing protein [Pseudomonadota bacterium]